MAGILLRAPSLPGRGGDQGARGEGWGVETATESTSDRRGEQAASRLGIGTNGGIEGRESRRSERGAPKNYWTRWNRYDRENVSMEGDTGGVASTLLDVTKRQFTYRMSRGVNASVGLAYRLVNAGSIKSFGSST
jgi:hypothetical protein